MNPEPCRGGVTDQRLGGAKTGKPIESEGEEGQRVAARGRRSDVDTAESAPVDEVVGDDPDDVAAVPQVDAEEGAGEADWPGPIDEPPLFAG